MTPEEWARDDRARSHAMRDAYHYMRGSLMGPSRLPKEATDADILRAADALRVAAEKAGVAS